MGFFGRKKKGSPSAASSANSSNQSTSRSSSSSANKSATASSSSKPPPRAYSSRPAQAPPISSHPPSSRRPMNSSTFQPLRHRSGSFRDRLHGYTKRTLGSGGTLYDAVQLPRGENCGSWVVVNLFSFFNDLSALWDVVSADPHLSTFGVGEGFPSGIEYKWSSSSGAPPRSCSAPSYAASALQWSYATLNNQDHFPDDDDEEACKQVWNTKAFAAVVGTVFKRLFRVYAILYASFFSAYASLDLAAELNSCFKHFMYFAFEFQLLQDSEISVLEVIVRPIREQHSRAEMEAKRDKENKAKAMSRQQY